MYKNTQKINQTGTSYVLTYYYLLYTHINDKSFNFIKQGALFSHEHNKKKKNLIISHLLFF